MIGLIEQLANRLNMNFITLITLCLATASFVLSAEDNSKYTTKYNNFDIDSVLNNEKILKNYVNCLVGEGNCTPQGRDLASEYIHFVFLW